MEKLDTAALRITEFIALGTDVTSVIAKYDAEVLGLAPTMVVFKAGFKSVSDLYAKEKGSPLSKEIEVADQRRDSCIIGIKGVAENYLRHYDSSFRTAADTLLRTINKYGSSIATQNYLAESESLRQLCEDLEAAGAPKDALTKLGLMAWATEMRAANTAFADIYLQRNKEASLQPTGNMKELRGVAKVGYDGLMNMLDARNLVTPSPDLGWLINEINALIGKYNRLVAGRKGNGDDEDEPPMA
jgi:Family of unknown function (DUF6261)